MLAEADALAGNGYLDVAETIYTSALTPGQTAPAWAAEGLGYVQQRREEAARLADNGTALAHRDAAGARACFSAALQLDRGNEVAAAATRPSDATPASATEGGWDAFYERWLGPTTRVSLPVLGALIVLLALARVGTSLVVPPRAGAWPDPVRRAVWWAGLGLAGATAVRLTLAMGWQGSELDDAPTGWRWLVLGVGVTLILVASGLARVPAPPMSRTKQDVAPLSPAAWPLPVVAVVVAIVWGAVGPPPLDDVWPWVLTLVLGLLGVVLLAAGRGHALRVRVEVRRGEAKDAAGAAFVLARLQDLGDSPPRGLKSPDQVDVTDLPAAALSSMPTGKLSAALASLVGLLQPSVPWRAVVDDCGGTRLIVTLTRNGPVVRTAVIDGARYGGTASPATSAPGTGGTPGTALGNDRGDLLTAAAALILTELAVRHRQLSIGLCGATDPESVAAHVVATRHREPPLPLDRTADLLGLAVERDPANALAWAALVHLQGRAASLPQGRVRHAQRVQCLMDEVDDRLPDDPAERAGYTPLRLRLAHSAAAAWLNACVALLDSPVAVGPAGRDEGLRSGHCWDQAAVAHSDLVALLRETGSNPRVDPRLRPFLERLGGIARALFDALNTLRMDAGGAQALTSAAELPVADSLSVVYDRACVAAARARFTGGGWTTAVDQLERVVSWGPLRAEARRDPFFAPLRTARDEEEAERFRDAVAEPSGSFLDLPVFGEKGATLRALGVRQPSDVLELTSTDGRITELSGVLDVPATVVCRWRDAARALDRPTVLQQAVLSDGVRASTVVGNGGAAPQGLDHPWRGVCVRALGLGLSDAELTALLPRLRGETPPG
ncbi:hypothetical protein ACI79C_02410 [Geodermatophilus sp. SYSU D00697]